MTDQGADLPLLLRAAIIAILTLLLALNIIADIFVDGYDGLSVTVMLGGLVGAGIGIANILKGGGDKP